MNRADDTEDRDAREDAAAEWLCERAEGFSPERAAAFVRWLDADPRNAAAVAHVERTLELLDELPAVRAPLEAKYGRRVEAVRDGSPEVSGAAPANGARVRWLGPARALGLAAAVAVAAVGGWSVQRLQGGERFATTATALQRVALQDGSIVDLNRASEVRVKFSAEQRRLTLGAGEAHFEVAHDSTRPFVVVAGGVTVRAIGTAFNVRLAGDTVDVVVTEGKVEVARANPARAARVAAGERVRLDLDERVAPTSVEKVEPAALRALLAWQDRMSFTDVPLRELVARFNRRNATRLVLDDAALGERKLGGVFALDQVDVFVRLLEQDGEIVAERRSEAEIVLRPAR